MYFFTDEFDGTKNPATFGNSYKVAVDGVVVSEILIIFKSYGSRRLYLTNVRCQMKMLPAPLKSIKFCTGKVQFIPRGGSTAVRTEIRARFSYFSKLREY